MVVVYASRTGNVKRFVSKIRRYDVYSIDEYDESLGEFVLITYTTDFGKVPQEVDSFLARHGKQMKAVAVSGNRNWGIFFGKSGDIIAARFNVPLLLKFELSGTQRDIDLFIERIDKIGSALH